MLGTSFLNRISPDRKHAGRGTRDRGQAKSQATEAEPKSLSTHSSEYRVDQAEGDQGSPKMRAPLAEKEPHRSETE